ncbi:MAG: hypothetical protein KME55_34185 [Nostoc indistinguendum CM1-VF10]|nr:hypothetical protein [Nostoc indistinguendum CM1-VF10]
MWQWRSGDKLARFIGRGQSASLARCPGDKFPWLGCEKVNALELKTQQTLPGLKQKLSPNVTQTGDIRSKQVTI